MPNDPFGLKDPFGLNKLKRDPFGLKEQSKAMNDPFGLKGTDGVSQLKKDLAEREALAKEKGLEVPEPQQGPLAPIMDLLARSEYARVAGIEAAAEHGAFSPQVPIKVGMELFSGIGGAKGQKKTFGDVMEERGVPEMGNVSDIPGVGLLYNQTGEGWKLQQGGIADPTGRGALALGTDIATDPTTPLSFGVTSTAKAVAKGGAKVFRLSEKGIRARAAMTMEAMPRAQRLAARLTRHLPEIDPVTAITRAQQADELSEDLARRMASQGLAKRIETEGLKEMLDPGGIQWAGRVLVPGERFKPFGKAIGDAAGAAIKRLDEMPIGAQMMQIGRSVGTRLDRTFQETLGAARKVPGYKEMVEEWRTGKRSSRNLLSGWIGDTFRGTENKYVTHMGRKMPLLHYLRRAAENPEAYPIEQIPAEHADLIPKMREALDHWFKTELDEGIMTKDQYRQGYVPLMTRNTREQMLELTQHAERSFPNMRGDLATIGPFGEARGFKNLDEMEAFHKQLYDAGVVKWRLTPIEDPGELLWKRGLAHYSALHGQRFYRKVRGMIGRNDKNVQLQVFRRALPGVLEAFAAGEPELLAKITADDIDQAAGTIAGVWPSKIGDYPFGPGTSLRRAKHPAKTVRYPVTEQVEKMVEHTPEPRVVPGMYERRDVAAGLGYTSPESAVMGAPPTTTWQPPSFKHPVTSDVTKEVSRRERARAGRSLSPAAKTLIIAARLRDSASPEQFFKRLQAVRKPLTEIDPSLMHSIDEAVSKERQAYIGSFNEPITDNHGVKFLEGHWIPDSISKDLAHKEDLLPAAVLRPIKEAVAAYDRLLSFQKGAVTIYAPAFHVRNTYSNVAQNFIDLGIQALDPVKMARAAAVMAGRDGTVVTPTGKYTYQQYRRILHRHGIMGGSWQGGDIIRPAQETPVAGNVFVRAHRKVEGASRKIEEWQKVVNHMTWMERGLTPTEAGLRTHKFLFDYEELSPVEKNYMRRIFLFYPWMRKNLTLTSREVFRRPGRYGALVKPFSKDSGPDEEALPDYVRGDLKLKVKRNGKTTYITGFDLPLNSAVEGIFGSVSDDPGQSLRAVLSQTTPVFKLLGEVANQQDVFNTRDWKESREKLGPIMAPMVEKLPPKWQTWLEYNPEHQDMNYGKAYLLFKSWALARGYSYLKKIPDKPNEMDQFAVDLLTGVKWNEFDVSEMEEKRLRERLGKVNDLLQRHGWVAEVPGTYVRKPKKEAP